MMSLATIAELSAKQAEVAARRNLKPYMVWPEDLVRWKAQHEAGTFRLPFPNIGDYRPVGYELVDTLFVDKSGWGADDEPALTVGQLLDRLQVNKAYAVIEEGQFQRYLGEFIHRA